MAIATRKVKVEAQDRKQGMTSSEIMGILRQSPPDLVPKVLVGLKGQIKSIELEIVFYAE